MRLCEKNKRDIWYSYTVTRTEEKDSDGNYTGVVLLTHTGVTKTRVNMYPSDGIISREIFGDKNQFDYMMVTIGSPFTSDTVFYTSSPSDAEKYNYIICDMKVSLNNTYYALKKVM